MITLEVKNIHKVELIQWQVQNLFFFCKSQKVYEGKQDVIKLVWKHTSDKCLRYKESSNVFNNDEFFTCMQIFL